MLTVSMAQAQSGDAVPPPPPAPAPLMTPMEMPLHPFVSPWLRGPSVEVRFATGYPWGTITRERNLRDEISYEMIAVGAVGSIPIGQRNRLGLFLSMTIDATHDGPPPCNGQLCQDLGSHLWLYDRIRLYDDTTPSALPFWLGVGAGVGELARGIPHPEYRKGNVVQGPNTDHVESVSATLELGVTFSRFSKGSFDAGIQYINDWVLSPHTDDGIHRMHSLGAFIALNIEWFGPAHYKFVEMRARIMTC